MKTYKFTQEETETLYGAVNFACIAAKKELEYDIELDKAIACKSIVEYDKAKYTALCRLKDILCYHTEIKIEGD